MATDLNYLKRAILTLALSADERDVPDLGARFYSYDKQSGKFIIRLIDEEDQPIDLSQFAIINMVMAPNRDISKGRTIVPMQAEDPEDGVVSVILPDNIRQFNGTIIAGVVAMNADNIKTHDFGYFRFEMQQSLIDANIENLSDFYVDEFEQLREQIRLIMQDTLDDIDAFKLNINTQLQELQNKINTARIDLDTLIAAINAAKINTRNVFDLSLITTPESLVRRRVPGNAVEIRGWGYELFNVEATSKMFKPNTTYHAKYTVRLLSLDGGALYSPSKAHGGLNLYSNVNNTFYPTIWIGEASVIDDFKDLKVGDTITRETTFTTPANFAEAQYKILSYSRRDTAGVTDLVRFEDIMVQEGTIFTGHQVSPNDVLTKYNEPFYHKNVFPDPKLTGTFIATPEPFNGATIEMSYISGGYLSLKNPSTTERLRIYWLMADMGINDNDLFQPFDVKVKIRLASVAKPIEIGFGSSNNMVLNPSYSWRYYTGTVQTQASNAFSIWLEPGQGIDIMELNIFKSLNSALYQGYEGLNIDTFVAQGNYKVRNMTGTIPPDITSTTFCYLTNEPLDNFTNVKQTLTIRTGLNLGNADYTYVRQRINSNWLPWQRVLTAMMDGNQASKTGADLNNEKISGEFVYINPINVPAGVGTIYGKIQRYGGAYVLQNITSANDPSLTYQRACINTVWSEWRKIPTLLSDGRVDTMAVDFNTLKETATIVNTSATNSPDGAASTSWYTDVVRYGSSGNYVYQRATRISSIYQNTYERQLFNGTWSPWKLLSSPYIDQVLGTTSDANKITTSQTIQLEATATSNLPTSGSGVYYYLETIARADNYVLQRATLRGGTMKTYTRQSHNGIWSAWSEDIDSTNNQTVGGLKNFTTRPTVNGAQVATNVEPTPLTGTVNWDSFDQPGRWYMSGIANGPKYLSNFGYLEVISHPSSVGAIQTYTDMDNNCIMRTRKNISGVSTWGPWKVIRLSLPEANLSYLTGWADYNTDTSSWQHAKVVRDGDTVTLAGTIRNTATFTPSNGQEHMANIPEGYRPKYNRNGIIMRSSGRTIYTCDVYTDGRLTNSTMVDPGINGYAGEQSAGKIFHISITYVGEDIAFF
jgi:hypothetical protein|nr:MAG TPA: distal tail protein [Caudoviricetes sp.]